MKRFACLAFVVVAACGDDGSTPPIDATVDAEIVDAPPPTVYSGTLTALEVAVLRPDTSGTFFGQGVQLGVAFQDSVNAVAPTMEEQPGSPLGCKLFQYTPAQLRQSSVGNDEGSVQFTVTQAANPMYPPCTFNAAVGYTCPQTTTFSNGGTIGPGPQAGLATLTDTDVTYNAANTTNRYINITGATSAGNNGAFPIVALGGANTIVYANPGSVAEAIPAAGSHVNLAGVGPTPMLPDPGILADDTQLSIALTPGGGNHLAAFTATTAPGTIGDDFTIAAPATRITALNNLPTTGAAFTFGCDAQMGDTCGSASGALLTIYTTDGSTAGLSPFALPPPTTKRVMVRCASLGVSSVTVPAAYMAAVMGSGWTRIQTTFVRPTLMSGAPATITAISGHAITGFTNRPQ